MNMKVFLGNPQKNVKRHFGQCSNSLFSLKELKKLLSETRSMSTSHGSLGGN